MTARADILAGRAVILVNIQDTIDAQLRTIRGKMRAFTNSISEIGGDLFRGGLAGSIGSILPVKSFTDFQDSMLFLQAKLKDTGVDVQQLEKYIRHLGRTTSFTSKEVAEGAAVLAQAGLGERVQAALLPTLDLARSERVDMETAGRILANTMMAFAIPSEKAAETASKLTTATRLGTTDLVMMAESLKYLQTTARGLNMGFEETLALVVQLSNVGMRGSIAGTSLNAALGNLAAKPMQLKEKLGLTFTPEEVAEPLKMFAKLREATKDMDVLTRKATMSSLFNIRGERAFSGILLQSLDELDNIINQISKSSTEARITSELLDSRLGGVWRRAKSAFEEMGLAIGETTEGPLTKFGNAAQKVFEDMSRLATANPQIIQTLLLIPPAAIAAGAGLLLLSTAMSKVILLIGPLLSANAMFFKTIAAIVGANAKLVGDLSSGIQAGALRLIGKADTEYATRRMSHTQRMAALTQKAAKAQTRQELSVTALRQATQKKLIELDQKHAQQRAVVRAKANQATIKDQVELNRRLADLQNRQAVRRAALAKKNAEALAKAETAIPALRFEGDVAGTTIGKKERAAAKASNAIRAKREQELLALREKFAKQEEQLERRFAEQRRKIRNVDGPRSEMKLLETQNRARKNLVSKAALEEAAIIKKGRLRTLAFNKLIAEESAIAPVDKSSFLTKDRGPGLFAGIGNIFREIWKGMSGIGRLGPAVRNAFKSFDIVRTTFRFFRGLLTVAKGIFTILNGIRRVLFSLSGWLVIVEVLILFGDKIPVVKDALAGLGVAFSNVFKNIGETLRNLGPSLSLITDGIRNIFTGDSMLGVQKLKAGFQDIADIISTGLNHAWQQFIKDIEPGALIIRNAITGIVGVFDALVASVGSVFDTTIKGGKILVSADDSITDMFKNLFSAENFQSVFAFIVQLIGEIGKGLNSAVGVIFTTLHGIKSTFVAILQSISRIPGFGSNAKKALGEMDENAPLRASLVAAIANTERIWAYERRKFLPDYSIYKTLKDLRQQLADLDFIKPFENTVETQNEALQTKINQIISGFNDMTTPLATITAEAKAAADAAALAARFRPSALAIGNTLGSPLATLSSPLLPGNVRPRQPLLTVPETGRQVGGGRGFNIMGTAEMQETALSLMEGLKKAFASQALKPPAAMAEAKAEAAKIGQAVKAVVGDFESTRGQKIQFNTQKLQEAANEKLDGILNAVDPLASLLEKQPRFA